MYYAARPDDMGPIEQPSECVVNGMMMVCGVKVLWYGPEIRRGGLSRN